jgi:hypothetical protein
MTVQANISAIKRQAAYSGANRRLEFHKRRQYFIRVHNETVALAAIRIGKHC